MMPGVGDMALDFTATTHQGRELSIASLRGRKVLLWFFPEAETPGCTVEGRGFRDHQSYFDDRNITVIGASFDSVERNAAFAKKEGFNFPLLSDEARTLGLAYGACDNPKALYARRISFLIDEQGRIERVYDAVDPRDHPAQVLADIIDSET